MPKKPLESFFYLFARLLSKKSCSCIGDCVNPWCQTIHLGGLLANHKSAKRRIRSSKRRCQYNKPWKTSLKTVEKTLRKQVSEKNKPEALETLKKMFSLLDKARKNRVIHKNKASKKKAQLSSKLSSLQA